MNVAEKRFPYRLPLFLKREKISLRGEVTAVDQQSFVNSMVDILCYAQLAVYRDMFEDVPNVSNVYWDRLSPSMIATIDQWCQFVLDRARQTSEPAVLKQEIRKLTDGALGFLSDQERQDFVEQLKHEMYGERFTEEIRKITTQSLNYLARTQPYT